MRNHARLSDKEPGAGIQELGGVVGFVVATRLGVSRFVWLRGWDVRDPCMGLMSVTAGAHRSHLTHKSHPFLKARFRITHRHTCPCASLDVPLTPLSTSWHDWRCKSAPSAGDEQSCNPVSEPIVDYWIDSRPGPGYSPSSGVIKKYK